MKVTKIKLGSLEGNTGQIAGLPTNPRQWTASDINTIAKSLKETPELLEARPLIVVEQEGKYIILGGNLRFEGLKRNKEEEAPCYIVPEGTPVDKLKEIVIKDNGSFGAWDYDALANEWDDNPLTEWGVPAWKGENINEGDFSEDFSLPSGDKETNQITFYFSPEQKEFVQDMMDRVEVDEDKCFGHTNKNANALYSIVEQWAEQKTL